MAVRVIFLPGFRIMRSSAVGQGMPVLSPRLLIRLFAAATCVLAFGAPAVFAQQAKTQTSDIGFDNCTQWKIDRLTEDYVKLIGAVECSQGDTQVFAEQLEFWRSTHLAVLTGNVTFRDKDAQISAVRAEINTETRLGTFHDASGFAHVAGKAKKDALGGQEPDVYFYGETVQKIGPDKYRITHGGFTTCVQPTPRWQITSGSVTLRVDHYAFLTNSTIEAKGVPVFYLPALFYPIQKDDRATGFLMPTYGTSSVRGFTLSNAFFWAINRSQDATFLHDYYASRGQGYGGEYRYVTAPGSSGNIRVYRLQERDTTDSEATQSYEIKANVSQALSKRWSVRGRVNYFSSLATQQTYNTDIYDASRSSRSYSGSVSGSALGLSLNAAFERTEYFSGTTSSTLTGGTPRISLSRNERPLFGNFPLYYSVNTEFVRLERESRSDDTVTDRGLLRADVTPTIRVPFTKWQFLTVNSSASWRGTYWTKSLSAEDSSTIVDEPISRGYFDLQSRITGPVFNRVWNTPDNGYAVKWKHTIEPYVTVQRVTSVDIFDQIVLNDSTDYVVGGTTKINYGVTNRLMAKRRGGEANGSAKEIVSVQVNQTYYSNDLASKYDYNYSTSFSSADANKLSNISMSLRATPADRINTTMRLEYNPHKGGLDSLSVDGQAGVGEWLTVNSGFSQRRYTDSTSLVATLDNYVNATATLRLPSNRVGGNVTFNYDIGRSTMLNSRVIAYYNAQCCGFAIEYQKYNLSAYSTSLANTDTRWNFSFTLAGLGTFSNFFGALGGSSSY
jgi:LPS-assembly protein